MYDANKCITCHAIDGKGMKKCPLDGIGTKLSADDIKKCIATPAEIEAKQAVKQPLKMKAFKLAPADLDALGAYLGSLKKKMSQFANVVIGGPGLPIECHGTGRMTG